MDFFPPNKRTFEFFSRHFDAEGLEEVVKNQGKKLSAKAKDQIRQQLTEQLQAEGATQTDVANMIKTQLATNELPEHELVAVAWDSLMRSVEWSQKSQQGEEQCIKAVREWGKILAATCTTARAEVQT